MDKLMDIYESKCNESVKAEIINQGIALSILAGGDNALIMALIKHFGKEFRKIIDEFKLLFNTVPTPDQLIWIAGVHLKKDPRVIAKELKKNINND